MCRQHHDQPLGNVGVPSQPRQACQQYRHHARCLRQNNGKVVRSYCYAHASRKQGTRPHSHTRPYAAQHYASALTPCA